MHDSNASAQREGDFAMRQARDHKLLLQTRSWYRAAAIQL
jgi:hypothetical protein